MQNENLIKRLTDCRDAIDVTIAQCTDIQTTSKAADLLLLAKTWPSVDDTLKTMLLQISGHPEAFQHSDLLSFLTTWMMNTTSTRYSLFVEVLKEVSKQNSRSAVTIKSTEKDATGPQVLGVCCEYVHHFSKTDNYVKCKTDALYVQKPVGDETGGLKTCQKHHENLKRDAKRDKTVAKKEQSKIEVVKETQSPHDSNIPQCEIAVGDDLLRLTQCNSFACARLPVHDGKVLSVCGEHLMAIRSKNPLPMDPPSTDYIVDSSTPVKPFDADHLKAWSHGYSKHSQQCQIVINGQQKCNNHASGISKYGIAACDWHIRLIRGNNNLGNMTVKR